MDERTRTAIAQWTTAQPAVSALVSAMVADRRDREDILQSAAVAVIESYAGFDPARPFLPWALGIARHHALDHLRRKRRAPSLLDGAALDALSAAIARVAEAESAKLAFLADCLERLEGRVREICDLRYRSDMTPQRIAVALGMHPNTVSKALQRARDAMRQCIEERMAMEETRRA